MARKAKTKKNSLKKIETNLSKKEKKLVKSQKKVFKKSKRRHPILFILLAGSGLILFWRGLWVIADKTPILSHGRISLLVGLALLLLTGALLKIL